MKALRIFITVVVALMLSLSAVGAKEGDFEIRSFMNERDETFIITMFMESSSPMSAKRDVRNLTPGTVEELLDVEVDESERFSRDLTDSLGVEEAWLYSGTTSNGQPMVLAIIAQQEFIIITVLSGPGVNEERGEEFGEYIAYVCIFGLDTDPPNGYEETDSDDVMAPTESLI